MIRVKIVKDYRKYKAGETVELTPNEAHGLIDRSIAVLTKDVVSSDFYSKTPYKRSFKRKDV